MRERELIIDSFAGGGGASLGIEWALGRRGRRACPHVAAALVRANIEEPQ
jgi:DNA (cytosine-5)-methyltransferase 1